VRQVYADFNNIDADGSLPLTSAGSVASIAELEPELRDGEEVCLADGKVFAVGCVHRRIDGTWEARSQWEFVHLPPAGVDAPGETLQQALADQQQPAPEPDWARPYRPSPPLWRSPGEKRGSPLSIGLGVLAGLVLTAALIGTVLEMHFLAGPATATPVTITAVERAPADDDAPPHFAYLAKLPDGRTERLTSEHIYRPGTRLLAMVSRGGLTGRTTVGPPYVVLAEE
jgi:hypothetical protein